MITINREELAWAGGFFSGEGCTKLQGDYAAISLCQMTPGTLHRFANAVGLGKVYGPYIHKQSKTDFYDYYCIGFTKVQATIAMLWPWLSDEKRKQAMIALKKDRRKPIHK